MSKIFETGAEAGTPSSVFSAIAGTPTFSTDFPASGSACLRTATSDTYGRQDFTANAICVAHFRVRPSVFAGADFIDIVRFQNNAGTETCAIGLGNDADRRLFLSHTFGVTVLDTFPALTPNQYYRVEFIVNATTNPWSVSWRVDGVDQGTFNPAIAGATFDRAFIGVIAGSAYDLRFDDIVLFTGATGDYPPGNLVVGLTLDSVLPDADIATTGWSTAPLFSKINDASDATVIQATAS